MGAQYDALRAVAQQTADQGREQAVLGDIHALIDEIQAKAESFTANPGMTGQTATAALNWLAEWVNLVFPNILLWVRAIYRIISTKKIL